MIYLILFYCAASAIVVAEFYVLSNEDSANLSSHLADDARNESTVRSAPKRTTEVIAKSMTPPNPVAMEASPAASLQND